MEKSVRYMWRKKLSLRGDLTLNLLTTTIVAPPSNASKWQMGFNLAFKGLKYFVSFAGYNYVDQIKAVMLMALNLSLL